MVAEHMQRAGEQLAKLSVQERDQLSVEHKNAVGNRRADWRTTTSVEPKDKTEAYEQQAAYAGEYGVKLEAELQKISDGILALMDKDLIDTESVLLQDEEQLLPVPCRMCHRRYKEQVRRGRLRRPRGSDEGAEDCGGSTGAVY